MKANDLQVPADSLQALTQTIKMHAAGARAEELHPRRVRHVVACGQKLVQLKELLSHGRWNRWVEEHCGLSRATASRYMRLAARTDKLTKYMTIREAYLAAGVISPGAGAAKPAAGPGGRSSKEGKRSTV